MADSSPLHEYSSSQAVVMGTWDYFHLPPVPAVANSLDRMAALLTGPWCDWPQDRVITVENERDPGGLPDRLITAFEKVTGIALFYYAGHGQIDLDDQLCLGLTGSRLEPNRRAATSLPFHAGPAGFAGQPSRYQDRDHEVIRNPPAQLSANLYLIVSIVLISARAPKRQRLLASVERRCDQKLPPMEEPLRYHRTFGLDAEQLDELKARIEDILPDPGIRESGGRRASRCGKRSW